LLDLPFLFYSDAIGIKRYCFPTFKDLLALPATRFLNGSAKVRAFLFLPNLSSFIFIKIRFTWIDNQLVL
jgi:hypothetical protein